ncbi:MAG: hypothetical protein H0T46_06240 [Deltaproteobacteria bacterium]|nr:hypothetical protein [Deltaproteobacteria bacterium]
MTRRQLAIIACLLWLVGVELLPAIHQASHDELAPHRHDSGGMVITVSFGAPAHRHVDGVEHEHAAPVVRYAPVRPKHDGKSRMTDGAAGDHAAGLAHHAVALLAPPPPMLTPLPVDRRPTSVKPLPIRIPSSATVPEAAARGPPVRAS